MVFSTLANPNPEVKLEPATHPRDVMALPNRATWKWPAQKPVRHRHPDQLDLFPKSSIGAIAEVVPISGGTPPTEDLDGRHAPAGQSDPHPLETVPSADGSGAGKPEPFGGNSAGSGSTGRGQAVRSVDGSQNGIPAGVGTGDGGMPATGRAELIHEEPDQKPSRDFRIKDAHAIGRGSLHDKALDNIRAIKTLKAIEAENRDATDEEKAVLARYCGWGGMPNVFHWSPPHDWKGIAKDVRSLLTDGEYESARASTPNAHFTSPMVIEAIWNGLRRMGVGKDAQMLEPAMGVGHFFGLMPESMQGGHRTGVELDSITARIAQKLYPDSTIFAKGFEETPLPDNYFDAVVGNVPFGDYAVHDPAMKPQLTRAIHDYFFAKSLGETPARRRDGAHHQPLHDGQAGRYDPQASGRTGRSAGRDPAAEHRLQGQCRNGSHHRHSVPAKARAGSRTRRASLARARRRSDSPDGPIADQRILRPPSRDDARAR